MARNVSPSRFAMQPRPDVPRSAFDMSHTHKTTFSSGWVVPLLCLEILPGDSMSIRMTAFCRTAPMIVPPMDNLYFESFFFFVPNRLVWDNWERFMGAQDSPSDTTAFLVPVVGLDESNTLPGSLYDWFGITCNLDPAASFSVNSLPFRAYAKIFDEWFRDQDLQDPINPPTDDGPDAATDFPVFKRGKRHDYFTTARPWPQKPNKQISTSSLDGAFAPGGGMSYGNTTFGIGAPVTGLGISARTNLGSTAVSETGIRGVTYGNAFSTAATDLYGRLDGANDLYPDIRVLVNDIRTSMMIQAMMERNARGGTRYSELVRSHFGVQSPDARLQRPEYLGGGRTMISTNPVTQTAPANPEEVGATVLGEQAGIGTVVAEHGCSQSFTEHGFLLGLVSVRGDLTYQQGVERMFWRRTLFDHYFPSTAHLGEQAIMRREIYCVGQSASDNLVFGYQERWAEYRQKPSRVSGFFRSTSPEPLDMWHFAQRFESAPSLNNAFIQEDPGVGRSLQTDGEYQEFMCDASFRIRAVRPLPMFSIPGAGPRL